MDGVLGVRHHEINFIIAALIIEEQERTGKQLPSVGKL